MRLQQWIKWKGSQNQHRSVHDHRLLRVRFGSQCSQLMSTDNVKIQCWTPIFRANLQCSKEFGLQSKSLTISGLIFELQFENQHSKHYDSAIGGVLGFQKEKKKNYWPLNNNYARKIECLKMQHHAKNKMLTTTSCNRYNLWASQEIMDQSL